MYPNTCHSMINMMACRAHASTSYDALRVHGLSAKGEEFAFHVSGGGNKVIVSIIPDKTRRRLKPWIPRVGSGRTSLKKLGFPRRRGAALLR